MFGNTIIMVLLALSINLSMSPKPQIKILGTSLNFANLWNEMLHSIPQFPLEKRNRIYASELGLPFIDRYLKMHAIPYSTPINDRSKRKFSTGEFVEWFVGLILSVAGILKGKQLRVYSDLPSMLQVSGKLDYVIDNPADWEAAKAEIKKIQDLFSLSLIGMPRFVRYAFDYIIPALEKQFKNSPVKESIFEVKSISSFVSQRIEKTGQTYPHYILQAFHYIYANKMDEGILFHLSKDDSKAYQFNVYNNKENLKLYKADIKQMTEYYNASNHKSPMTTLPPKERETLFDETTFTFGLNKMGIEWSNYLELLYGYKTPEEYRLKLGPSVRSWNYTFKRCVRGDRMTDKNLDAVRSANKIHPDWDKYVTLAKKAGAFQKPEEAEDDN